LRTTFGCDTSVVLASLLQPSHRTSLIDENGYKRYSNSNNDGSPIFCDYLLILRNLPFGSTSKPDSFPFVVTTTL